MRVRPFKEFQIVIKNLRNKTLPVILIYSVCSSTIKLMSKSLLKTLFMNLICYLQVTDVGQSCLEVGGGGVKKSEQYLGRWGK